MIAAFAITDPAPLDDHLHLLEEATSATAYVSAWLQASRAYGIEPYMFRGQLTAAIPTDGREFERGQIIKVLATHMDAVGLRDAITAAVGARR